MHVLILIHNSAADLATLLPSLMGQLEASHRVTLIDNASTDDVASVLQAYPSLKYIRFDRNLGYAAAHNRVLAEIYQEKDTDLVLLLNPDTQMSPHTLPSLTHAYERLKRQQKGHLGLIQPLITLMHEPTRVNTMGSVVHITGLSFCGNYGELVADMPLLPTQITAATGCALLFHRSLYERVGGFDPDYFMYLEDTELSLRASAAGFTHWVIPTVQVTHRYRFGHSDLKWYHAEKNRLMLIATYWPTLILVMCAVLFLMGEVISLLYLTIRGHGGSKIRGYHYLLHHGMQIRKKRRQLTELQRWTIWQTLKKDLGPLFFYMNIKPVA